MLNVNELRVGNLVKHLPVWSYRQPFEGPNQSFEFAWDERDWYAIGECTMSIEAIDPIPLTKDWLKRLGFIRGEKNHWSFTDGMELRIFGDSYDYTGIWIGRIWHVHQLQNLYFAMTGDELQITEP